VIVLPDGSTRRFAAPEAIETRNGSLAILDVGPDLETSVLWLDTDGDGFNIGREEIDVEVGEVPAPSVIAARFEHTVNPVRSGPYRNVMLLLSRPVDGEALSALPSEGWQLNSELTLAGDDGAALVSSRARSGRSFRLQLDPRIVVATFATPLNRHAAMSLSSGGAPLVMVDGTELDIFGLPLVTGEGLESGAVRGVVLGPEGGPLEGALVELYEELELCDPIQGCSWFPSLADRVRSDAAGGFVFDAVRYRDQVIPTREAAFTVRAVDQTTGHETRLTARLQGDGRVRPLTLAMVGRGDVVGTLRNEDGSPLQDPLVVARSIATPSEGAQTVPDGAGRFRLTDLPVGPVQLVARDGQRYTSGTVRIPAPGAEATIDLVLLELGQPLAAVRGSVVDGASAEPIPGLDVYVTPAGFEGPTHAATTDDIGAFAMADVPPGVARFKAWNPALGRYVAEAVAELRGDATTTVELVVQESATGAITGTVTLVAGGSEAPVAGAYVVARNHGVFTLTGADGRYELMEIPLGRVELEVWDPVTAAAASRTVDLTADGQILVLDFALREDQGLGSVTVNVAESGGVPVVNAEVALARFGSGFEARTGGDGSARIEGVPPGKHDILVRLGSRLARGAVELLYPGHAAAANLLLGPLVNATVRVQAEQTGVGASDVLAPISYRVPGVTSTGRIGLVPEDGWSQCELDNEGVCAIDDIPTHVGSLVATATSGFYGPVSVSRWIDESLPHDLVINFKAPGGIGGRVVRRVDDGL
ncbi:MAG TPA: carboxypeptidase-like regulatory domain-containing protein, partial [Candidatus Sulfomarinibacteraceae bacterium]|nr:carboxypeptidase-like regulatory domain-containing protein [Candidatus Sulfomarinibacteraceae bacterium]